MDIVVRDRRRDSIDRGELAPDEVVTSIVSERIRSPDAQGGFLLDGFPRTWRQAVMLDSMLLALGRSLAGVIWIRLGDEEVVKRLAGRLTCPHCGASFHREYKPPVIEGVCDVCDSVLEIRDDDKPATVRVRLGAFHARTQPLIQFYEARGLLLPVDGSGTVAKVCQRTLRAVEGRIGPPINAK